MSELFVCLYNFASCAKRLDVCANNLYICAKNLDICANNLNICENNSNIFVKYAASVWVNYLFVQIISLVVQIV